MGCAKPRGAPDGDGVQIAVHSHMRVNGALVPEALLNKFLVSIKQTLFVACRNVT
jgi:hypothetical protein